MVAVYNSTAQAAFFDFACLQHVIQVYDAPHAGNRPHSESRRVALVESNELTTQNASFPCGHHPTTLHLLAVGANPADEAMYRSFVEAAGSRGIDVQFLSGLNDFEYDMQFIASVNTSIPKNTSCHWGP